MKCISFYQDRLGTNIGKTQKKRGVSLGWTFLNVGSGSGMLPGGGSYVSLVSPGTCSATKGGNVTQGASGSSRLDSATAAAEFTIVLQVKNGSLSPLLMQK